MSLFKDVRGRLEPDAEETAERELEPGEVRLPTGLVAPDPTTLPEFAELAAEAAKAMNYANQVKGEVGGEDLAKTAADVLKELKGVLRKNKATREELARAYNDAKERLNAAFKEQASPIQAAFESLSNRLLAYQKAKKERLDAARRKEEEEARKAQEAENAAAEQEGRMSHHKPPPAPKAQPKGTRGLSGSKATGVEEVKYEITDEALLPNAYVKRVPIRSKIQADVRAGIVIPGVRPYTDEKLRVS